MSNPSVIYTEAWREKAAQTSNPSDCTKYALQTVWNEALDRCLNLVLEDKPQAALAQAIRALKEDVAA